MQKQVLDKVVAITGAGSGIGKAIAIELARYGAKVVVGSRTEAALIEVVEQIKQAGGEAVHVVTNVKNKEDLLRLVNTAVDTYGRLDVMVNNAGVAHISPIDELDLNEWEEMIDSNLKGVLYGMAAAIPIFKQQLSGHIINIISTSGLKIVPTQGVYAATKNAVRTLTEAFRQESDGTIRITGISPGYVKTNLVNTVKDEAKRQQVIQAMEQLGLPPVAVANAVIYAVSQPAHVEVGDIVIRPAKQN
ncbi:SDR family oxidoreductase [Spirosoma linguale]|uniref:Short-chain dehydrogenase/reductase SDR n=1 Tax=Spirosoma linguale (strain ATCC 33905 / DSM 74 / LMG 10896 / Claus 1) TaxID=504472 RepID=D2QDL5_SPILD|nr:short-chain dehydrogenase/reductase SDR [Spirosoma linguale DSM 74]